MGGCGWIAPRQQSPVPVFRKDLPGAVRLIATAQRRHRIKPFFDGGGAAMPQGSAALRLDAIVSSLRFTAAEPRCRRALRRSDSFAALRLFRGARTFSRCRR
jgi:hypothetical protein